MSIGALSWAWDREEIDSPATMIVLHHLADSANACENETTRWPLTRIAKRCRCSQQTARRHLLKIWQLGLIDKIREHQPNQLAAVYRVNWMLSPVEIAQRVRERMEQPENDAVNDKQTDDNSTDGINSDGYQIDTRTELVKNCTAGTREVPEGCQRGTPTGITSDQIGVPESNPNPNKTKLKPNETGNQNTEPVDNFVGKDPSDRKADPPEPKAIRRIQQALTELGQPPDDVIDSASVEAITRWLIMATEVGDGDIAVSQLVAAVQGPVPSAGKKTQTIHAEQSGPADLSSSRARATWTNHTRQAKKNEIAEGEFGQG